MNLKFSKNINFTNELFLVDGLTLDDIKAKYSWILNAKYKRAIIGEDDEGLIWYAGEWICGEWLGGKWYSGIFHDGVWERGDWYSYKIDIDQIKKGVLRILSEENNNSQFRKGEWLSGTFHDGIFGFDEKTYKIANWESYPLNWDNNECLTNWRNGIFLKGFFNNSCWYNGNFVNGIFYNSKWYDGSFTNGVFIGYEWYGGNFNGGNFQEGKWYNGVVEQTNPDIIAKFGYNEESINDNKCIWYNGIFKKGQFHSGKIKKLEKFNISENNKYSIWYDGVWENGEWIGGQFQRGIWMNGVWYGGIWGTWSSDWITPKSYISYDGGDSQWKDAINLTDDNIENFSYIVFDQTSSGTTGLTSNYIDYYSNILVLKNFDTNLNINDKITGIKIKMVRSGYYNDYIAASTNDIVSIGFDDDTNIEGDNLAEVDIYGAFSSKKSFEKEEIKYGNYLQYWGFTGLTASDMDNIVIKYRSLSRKRLNVPSLFELESRLYSIQIKIFYQSSPDWYGGDWYSGLWINGTFHDGNFYGGNWINGEIININMSD